MRQLRLLVLVVFFGLVLAGCSHQPVTGNTTDPQQQVSTTPNPGQEIQDSSSTGDVDKDFEKIEGELDNLNTDDDFPTFNDKDLGL